MTIINEQYRQFCVKHFPLPSEEQVAALERRMQISLPPDFRRYVLDFNGGYFNEPDIVPTVPDCPLDCLTVLNGISASDYSAELGSVSDLGLFTDNFPPQILPIGYTLMGNLIFIITHLEGRGTIGLKIASQDQSYFLASGIEDFFSILRQPSDD